jgi:hypothetical protein
MTWAPDYITTAQFRLYTKNTIEDDEADIATAISAASRAIDRCTYRQFGKVAAPEARYYTPRWDSELNRYVAEVDDLQSTTGLTIAADLADDDSYSTSITSYVMRPRNAIQTDMAWTQIAIGRSGSQPDFRQDSLKVTAPWGWTTVPSTIVTACKIQAHRFFERRDAPFGSKGNAADGNESSLLERVDADVETMLDYYVRQRWTA